MPMPLTTAESLLPELFSDSDAPDMRFAAHLIAQVQRELAQRNRKLLRTVSRWLDLYEYVKMLETERLLATDPLQAQTQHFPGTLFLVHGLGVVLLAKLNADEAAKIDSLGLTYKDLAACVEELEDTHRSLHSDMTPGMIAKMNDDLFGIR
jgi:hypothetical protein